MKISIDASDSLDDALRVVGAMYGVTLRVTDDVSSADSGPALVSEAPAPRRRAARNGSSGRSRRTASSGRRSTSRRGRGPSATDVRQWARDNGVAVNERGRIPASVLAAYRESSGR